MLDSWLYFLTVERWSDLSLIIDRWQFRSLDCFKESGGLVAQGWGCLFNSMTHMCVFDTAEVRPGNYSSTFTFAERLPYDWYPICTDDSMVSFLTNVHVCLFGVFIFWILRSLSCNDNAPSFCDHRPGQTT